MSHRTIHECECQICRSSEAHPDKVYHHQMNVVLSRLDEQQRRWSVAMEANRLGHGGTELLSEITGMNVNTIRKGRRELANDLVERPNDRIRMPGGGRKTVEKKRQT
jgi:hypothetical protein